jgi:hypothetical protein
MSKEKMSPEKAEKQETKKKEKEFNPEEDSYIGNMPDPGHDDGPSTNSRSGRVK